MPLIIFFSLTASANVLFVFLACCLQGIAVGVLQSPHPLSSLLKLCKQLIHRRPCYAPAVYLFAGQVAVRRVVVAEKLAIQRRVAVSDPAIPCTYPLEPIKPKLKIAALGRLFALRIILTPFVLHQ